MADFDDFINMLKDDLIDLAKEFGDDVKDEIIKDAESFATELKEDLEEWTQKVQSGDLTQNDLEWLIKGKKDLAQMEALKQKGLAKAKIDKYRNALLETTIGSVVKLLE